MAKAVLVMDMPDSCMGCNFLYCDAENNTESCQAREKVRIVNLEKESKPDWCPLRQMPEKMNVCGKYPQPDGIVPSYKVGWNDCIDTITNLIKSRETE